MQGLKLHFVPFYTVSHEPAHLAPPSHLFINKVREPEIGSSSSLPASLDLLGAARLPLAALAEEEADSGGGGGGEGGGGDRLPPPPPNCIPCCCSSSEWQCGVSFDGRRERVDLSKEHCTNGLKGGRMHTLLKRMFALNRW